MGDRGDGPTYYRWRAEYGGLKLDQVKRLKQLEAENTRLRKAVAGPALEKVTLGKPPRETSERRASSGLRLARHDQAGYLGTACLQDAEPAPLDAAQGAEQA